MVAMVVWSPESRQAGDVTGTAGDFADRLGNIAGSATKQ
jgi:hypothetical protein